jgi:HemY protein
MKLLIIVILSLAAATTIGLVSLDNPGIMLVSYGSHSWEMPLVLALLFIAVAFALLYLAFNFLFGVLRAPKKARAWNEQRQNRNAQDDTLRGYARLIEGEWAQGEKDLVKRLNYCKTPMLNYLGAAYAAQQQLNYEQRDKYLAEAEKIDPKNRMAIDISRARMLTQEGDFERARALLSDMQELAPANKTILRLMADVCKRTEDWEGLNMLLPRLEKTKALPEDQIVLLEVAVRSARLNTALPDAQNPSTLTQYQKLPGKRKKQAQIAAMYANKLIEEGDLSAAELVVRKAIKKNWSSELAGLYGKTRIDNLRSQILLATSWLANNQNDANVNLTLARLNLAYGQLDKARVYYNMAIELGASEEAYLELGKFYEEEGNHKTALAYYKRGIEASISVGRETQIIQQASDTKSLESIVTPGSSEMNRDVVDQPQASLAKVSEESEIQDATIIEHKA